MHLIIYLCYEAFLKNSKTFQVCSRNVVPRFLDLGIQIKVVCEKACEMLQGGALSDPLQHHPHASVDVKLTVHSIAVFCKKVPYWRMQWPHGWKTAWKQGGLWAEEADLLHVEPKQVEPSWKFSICSLWFFSYIYHLKIKKVSTKHRTHPTNPECSLSAWKIILWRKISRPTCDNI